MTGPDASKDDDVAQEAALWAVRAADGDMSAAQRAQLDAWLAADGRHRGAYLRARAGLKVLDRGIAGQPRSVRPGNDNESPAPTRPGGLSRRWRIGLAVGGMAVAASLAALVMVGGPDGLRFAPPGIEQAGRNRQVLADGSTVTLEPGARTDVTISADGRRVILLAGGATFAVARDPSRPFVVHAGLVRAEAVGTVYSVRRLGERGGVVEVAEGVVRVWAEGADQAAVLLRAGDRLTLTPAPAAPDSAAPAPKPAPASTPAPAAPMRLSFEDTPVALAVRQFNRANRTQIVIADDAIGEIEIVGRFRRDDPESFARAIASLADGEIVNDDGRIVIKSKN